MALERVTGELISSEVAERLTAFTPGYESWPHAGMLAAAQQGFKVVAIEDFAPADFIRDPYEEVERQVGSRDLASDILGACADIEREKSLVRLCLQHPLVEFVQRSPGRADLVTELGRGSGIILNVNNNTLNGTDGYNGHFVTLTGADADGVVIQNPGLPPFQDQRVEWRRFLRAWAPEPGYANLVSFSKYDSPGDADAVPVSHPKI